MRMFGDLSPKVILDAAGNEVARLHGKVMKLAPGYRLVRYRTPQGAIKAEIIRTNAAPTLKDVAAYTAFPDAAMNPLSQVLLPGVKRSDYAVNPLSYTQWPDPAMNPLSQVLLPGVKRSDYAVNPLSYTQWPDPAMNPLSDMTFNQMAKSQKRHGTPGWWAQNRGKKIGWRKHKRSTPPGLTGFGAHPANAKAYGQMNYGQIVASRKRSSGMSPMEGAEEGLF